MFSKNCFQDVAKLPYLVICLVTAISLQATAVHGGKPNFIVINIDDLGYGDIGPYGSSKHRTPNLDQMANEGRRLKCFYAAPVCSPSRASLMTGCYPKRVLSIKHVLFPGNAEGLDPQEITIAEVLKKQGYATGIVGKWHLGDQPDFLPNNQGFDYYFGLPYSNDMGPVADGVKSNLGAPIPKRRGRRKGQPPLPLLRNGTILQRVLPQDQREIVERYTQEAVKFIWDHRDQPFFLYLPHSAVHFPLYPSERFKGASKNGLFGDWVQEVDWSVGKILETVRQLKLENDTLVLFTSDNGGAPRHGASNAPLRGGKGSTFEGGMRVPTIAWWPGSIPAGTETDELTSTMDLMPTLARLAGTEAPKDRKIDGHDIWPIINGRPNAKSPYSVFYFYRGLNLQAIRAGKWKLHLRSGELFNLADDISESNNLAGQYPEIVKRLRQLAAATDRDLGRKGIGPGVRKLGKVANAKPLISHEGTSRRGFERPTAMAGMGIMVGEVSPSSALAQVRLTKDSRLKKRDLAGTEGTVHFELRTAGSKQVVGKQSVRATAERDYIARASFTGLRANQVYEVQTVIEKGDSKTAGPTATFRTLAGATKSASTRFVVVTGMNYAKFHGDNRIDGKIHVLHNNTKLPPPYAGADKHLGYPSLHSILKLQPHFFVGTGDNVYYDTPKEPRAKTTNEMRQKWHEQFAQQRYRDLFAAVPTYWMIDDHDYRIDDGDNSGDFLPTPAEGRRMMLEQLPVAPADEPEDEAKTYRTHRVSKELQIWFPENRMYRSDNKTKDGPDKTIWGVAQKAWLKKTLKESDATFKLLISPNPMIGPDDARKTDNHTNIGGFRHERDEFFAWLKENKVDVNFYLICGDRHWQYHSIHPTGIEEFSCGALVDPNSRPGRKPGDPKSTDPEGKIKQVYAQSTPSGGFLMVDVTPAAADKIPALSFQFYDELGRLLHEKIKSAR